MTKYYNLFLSFIRRNSVPICISLVVSLIIAGFMYAREGVARELISNSVYIDYINSYPQGISLRLEPVFIAIAVFFTRILHIPVLDVLSLLKIAILFFDLVTLYAIMYKLTSKKVIANIGVLIFGFSSSLVLISDNLLRNHLGMLVLLVVLYLWIIFITSKRSWRTALLIGLLTGSLAYIHILPFLIMSAFMFAYFCVLLIDYLLKKNKIIPDYYNDVIKLFIVIFTFYFIASGSFLRDFTGGRFRTDDFNREANLSSSLLGSSRDDLVDVSGEENDNSTNGNGVEITSPKKQSIVLRVARLLFEYRDISLPITFMAVVFAGVVYLFFKEKTVMAYLLILLWAIDYGGTKLDFFGVDTLSFRFSLMLTVPSLIIFLFMVSKLVKNVQNMLIKMLVYLFIIGLFLAHNIPNILEVTVLKNYQNEIDQKKYLKEELSKYPFIPEDLIVNGGASIEGLGLRYTVLYDTELFTKYAASRDAYMYAKERGFDYIIIDRSKTNRSGNDLGVTHTMNYKVFENSKYFAEIFEKKIGFSDIVFYQVGRNAESTYVQGEVSIIQIDPTKGSIDSVLPTDSTITSWDTRISIGKLQPSVTEEIKFEDMRSMIIEYNNAPTQVQSNLGLWYNQLDVNLMQSKRRDALDTSVVSFSLDGAQIMLNSRSLPTTKNSELTKLAYNKLFYQEYIHGRSHIVVRYLSRVQFKLWIHYIIFVLIAIAFCVGLLTHRNGGMHTMRKNDYVLLIVMCIFILDLIFLDIYFIEFYKKMIGQ